MLFAEIGFVEVLFVVSIISSQVITESSVKLHTHLLFLQLHVAGFQILSFFADMMFFQAFTLTQTFIVILLLFSVIFSTTKIAFALG